MSVSLNASLGSSSLCFCVVLVLSAISRLSLILDNDKAETLIVPSGSGCGFGGGTTLIGSCTSSSCAGSGAIPFCSGLTGSVFSSIFPGV